MNKNCHKNSVQQAAEIHYPGHLPIVSRKEEIIEAIQQHQVIIISGETGSGKSTQIPKMCLEAGFGSRKMIGCTQPRRLAAVSVAGRVGKELGDHDQRVAYKIRFQDKTQKSTIIKFMTDGVLLAEARGDRNLSRYEVLIIDEAHERSLNIDFILGILKTLLLARPDLKLIITSATIDCGSFSENFRNAPIITVSGRTYPVEVRYAPVIESENNAENASYLDHTLETVNSLVDHETPGDVLVFMPTERDVRETIAQLNNTFSEDRPGNSLRWGKPLVLPLFGRLSAPDQQKIFAPSSRLKIIVATNVAETSITVPGIRYVIDTGLARIPVYNVRARTTKMPIVPISQASADQRKGRCGRVGPGICIRLYGEDDYCARAAYSTPEILRSNLAEVILRMYDLGLGQPSEFPFLSPPSPRAITDAYALLIELGAFEQREDRLTAKGKLMAKMPLDPQISRMILGGQQFSCLREMTIIAAALSIQDPRVRPVDMEKQADEAHAVFVDNRSDFLSFVKIWQAFFGAEKKLSQSRKRKFCRQYFLSWQRMREWQDIHQQIWSVLAEINHEQAKLFKRNGTTSTRKFTLNQTEAHYDFIHQAILSGNLRNIAMRKETNIYIGGGGKELHVFPGSGLYKRSGRWIMAAELVETSRLYGRTVGNILPEWIESLAQNICRYTYSEPHWEKKSGRTVVFEQVSIFGLIIVQRRTVDFGRINPEEARKIFIEDGCVAGQLGGNYRFFNHNQALIQSIEILEDRLRKRDLLCDSRAHFDFYDKRLPGFVHDRRSLNQFIRKPGQEKRLFMQKEDLLARQPAGNMEDLFPGHLLNNGIEIALSYRFAPGDPEDGVTAVIPVAAIDHLQVEMFDWLVPGLLEEKIAALLKGLPKSLRRRLVPIPATAGLLMNELICYQGFLLRSLEHHLLRLKGVSVHAQDWQFDKLPEHFQMNFHLVDHHTVLRKGRNFRKLIHSDVVVKPQDDRIHKLKNDFEKDLVSPADLDGLPQQIQVIDSNGLLSGYLYPGIVCDLDNHHTLQLFDRLEAAREATRSGLAQLFKKGLGKTLHRQLLDLSQLPADKWAYYEGLETRKQLQRYLENMLLEEIFETRSGAMVSADIFQKQLQKKGSLLSTEGKRLHQLVVDILQQRREVLDLLAAYRGMASSPIDPHSLQIFIAELDHLVPADFPALPAKRLSHTLRYLKALQKRIERFHLSPAKDEAKCAILRPFIEKLADLDKKHTHSLTFKVLELKTEFEMMLEEFKVSLFAQELKTPFPVSAKKLSIKWQELMDAVFEARS